MDKSQLPDADVLLQWSKAICGDSAIPTSEKTYCVYRILEYFEQCRTSMQAYELSTAFGDGKLMHHLTRSDFVHACGPWTTVVCIRLMTQLCISDTCRSILVQQEPMSMLFGLLLGGDELVVEAVLELFLMILASPDLTKPFIQNDFEARSIARALERAANVPRTAATALEVRSKLINDSAEAVLQRHLSSPDSDS
eukprot:ANDGO_06260.mRNA.1 hypothetical protein